MDFFIIQNHEPIRTDAKFGLRDNDGNFSHAYSTTDPPETTWLAIVENPDQHLTQFYPIDNIVELKNNLGQQESLCDGMLSFNNKLFLIELKDRGKKQNWRSKAKKQLINTIKLLMHNNSEELKQYSVFKACICNAQHPFFEELTVDEENEFSELSQQLGIRLRLDIQATIKLK